MHEIRSKRFINSDWQDSCALCPRECHARRGTGERGFCGQSAEITCARASLHFWEEPCISGKRGSGTVFFCGCSLGCVYCQNAEISSPRGRIPGAKTLTAGELADVFLRLQDQGACNINLVTPTHFAPGIADALTGAKTRGLLIPVVWNTSGYEKTETLRELDGLIDIYLTDAKYADTELAERYSRAPDYSEVFRKALEEMVRQTGKPVFEDSDGNTLTAKEYNDRMDGDPLEDYDGPLMKRGTIVRHLLLPGSLADTKRIIDYLLPKYSNLVYLSLMQQYTPIPAVQGMKYLCGRVSATEYEEAVGHALSMGLTNGFFQGEGTDEDSFIPVFDGRGL